jgi:hypothetical protein
MEQKGLTSRSSPNPNPNPQASQKEINALVTTFTI